MDEKLKTLGLEAMFDPSKIPFFVKAMNDGEITLHDFYKQRQSLIGRYFQDLLIAKAEILNPDSDTVSFATPLGNQRNDEGFKPATFVTKSCVSVAYCQYEGSGGSWIPSVHWYFFRNQGLYSFNVDRCLGQGQQELSHPPYYYPIWTSKKLVISDIGDFLTLAEKQFKKVRQGTL